MELNFKEQSVKMITHTPEPFEIIKKAGMTAYRSESKKDSISFAKMLIALGHESVLEHVSFTFEIVCDRGVSHELVRHRLASYTQESTRYVNFIKKDAFFIRPNFKNPKSVINFNIALKAIIFAYNEMILNDESTDIARDILPNCLATTVVMTMNLRELRHFLKLRLSKLAHYKMREIATLIFLEMGISGFDAMVEDCM
jgi:thymidylate synthase (FAD)